jgi:hypothetical protein
MKYVPLALNSLYSIITRDEFVENEDFENENENEIGNKNKQIVKDYDI